jgi:hypothetical protein
MVEVIQQLQALSRWDVLAQEDDPVGLGEQQARSAASATRAAQQLPTQVGIEVRGRGAQQILPG